MKKHSYFRFLKNKYFIIGLIMVLIILAYYLTHQSATQSFESTAVSKDDVIERVSVTGAVSPVGKADLSFEKSGVISRIYVKVGDMVKAGEPIASLDSGIDSAALAAAQASLDDMTRSLRPQEYAVDKSTVDTASTSLQNALKDGVSAVHNGYVQALNAIVNYSDSFFTNAQTINPTINLFTQSTSQQQAIDSERSMISATLDSWKSDSDNVMSDNAARSVSDAEEYISSIKRYLSDLSAIVNYMTPGDSGFSKSNIDADMATMNLSLSTFNQAITTISAADAEIKSASSVYDQAQSSFSLQQAGSSPEAIAAQEAKVAGAQAVLAEDAIISPIDGIVTKDDPNVGEFATAGQSGFAVQNNGFKVEAFVPEADIAKVAVGNFASSTLDAYGAYVNFPAHVIIIDPAETVIEGVPTYKVTLQFDMPDPRIRSGMTANLEILTHSAIDVLEIPYRAIMITATSTSVRLVSKDGKTYSGVPVVTGLRGSDGTIEIVSGLNEGDKVVTYVK